MAWDDGPLVAADEWFGHQIVETHAHVADADRSWTEKVCAMVGARDGSLGLGFGVGKYTNRNVFDGYAGVSRGREQWTVRGSRRLSDDADVIGVGPIRYEVLEPYRRVRFSCAPNDVVAVAFEWTFEAVVPPVLEARDRSRARRGYRLDADVLRYHQTGVASGWVEVGGERHEITPDGWFSTRDHSWGVRQGVGVPPADLEGGVAVVPSFRFSWSPMLLERPDGSRYGLHHQHRQLRVGGYEETSVEGGVEHPDGRVERFVALRPDLYFGLDGHFHGEWRGADHVDGEYLPDCTDRATAERIHQIRDAIVRVDDPVGGGRGWGNLQTTITGAWPDEGLDEETSFV
jgi:hypothetical protein